MTKSRRAGTIVAAIAITVSMAGEAQARPLVGNWGAPEVTFKVKGHGTKIKKATGLSTLDCGGQMFWGFGSLPRITIEDGEFEYVDKDFFPAPGPDYVLTFKGKVQGPDTIKGSYQVSKRLTCTSNKVDFVAHPTL